MSAPSAKRLFEMLPAALSWGTILLMVFLSWRAPAAVAVFIILFDIYWLLKTLYLSFHLRATFIEMRANLQIDWRAKLEDLAVPGAPRWTDLYHLVIFPMYREPYEVVRESFERLKEAQYPKDKMFVVLALEERGGEEAFTVGRRIEEEFGDTFGAFRVTVHPSGLPGEIPGKGSNDCWAAREALREIIDVRKIAHELVLVSVFDIDTQVFPHYFSRLVHEFLSAPDRLRAIYQPVPFYTNNIYQAPALARIVSFSSTFWQMMQQARPERLTSFSSQSLPLPVLLDVGYWQKDVVSEDSQIFWQAFMHYDGNFRVVPLAYPVSMDANVAPTFWGTMWAVYKQHRRWGWGAENVPFMLEGFRTNPRIPRGTKWYLGFHTIEGYHSWATNALMIFALGWLPLALGGDAFNATMLSYNLPYITRLIVGLSMFGIASSAVLSVILLPPRPSWFKPWHYFLYMVQWLLMPLTLIFFGAFPGLEAQTRLMLGGRWRLGFWVTPKGRYPKTREEGRG